MKQSDKPWRTTPEAKPKSLGEAVAATKEAQRATKARKARGRDQAADLKAKEYRAWLGRHPAGFEIA